jgi:hypothetical protein
VNWTSGTVFSFTILGGFLQMMTELILINSVSQEIFVKIAHAIKEDAPD